MKTICPAPPNTFAFFWHLGEGSRPVRFTWAPVLVFGIDEDGDVLSMSCGKSGPFLNGLSGVSNLACVMRVLDFYLGDLDQKGSAVTVGSALEDALISDYADSIRGVPRFGDTEESVR